MLSELRARELISRVDSLVKRHEEWRSNCINLIASEISEKTGIPRRTRVLVGAGDDVDALGVGAIKHGQATEHRELVGKVSELWMSC